MDQHCCVFVASGIGKTAAMCDFVALFDGLGSGAADVANIDNQVASGPVGRLCGISLASFHKRNPPGLRSSFVSTGDPLDLIDHFPLVLY